MLSFLLKFRSVFSTSPDLLLDKLKKKKPCDEHVRTADLCRLPPRWPDSSSHPLRLVLSTERCSASSSVCWQQTLDFVSQAGITQFPQLPLIKMQILHHHKELAGRLTVHCRCCKCQSKERVAMERAWERHLHCVLLPCCLSLGACSFWSDWICLCYLIMTPFLTCLLSSLL